MPYIYTMNILFHHFQMKNLNLMLVLVSNYQHQRMYEREAFEEVFSEIDYEHYGFYGSCGLGVVKKRKEKMNIKVYYRLSNLEAGMSKKKNT